MPKKTTSIPKSTSFEDALAELETIVQTLETGDQSLEVSLTQFERGIGLARFCQQSLATAEQKVRILTTSEDDQESLQDLDSSS